MTSRLIVFTRVPVLGRVKTRIAAVAGAPRALDVHRRLLATTVSQLAGDGAWERELHLDGNDADGECAALAARHGYRVHPQAQGDLGERMHRALCDAMATGVRAVLVGSDCPELRASDVAAAFEALADVDAVFCPAHDGGYALVGVARPLPMAFTDIDWGTGRVMAQTRSALQAASVRWRELRTVADVDTWDDYLRWSSR